MCDKKCGVCGGFGWKGRYISGGIVSDTYHFPIGDKSIETIIPISHLDTFTIKPIEINLSDELKVEVENMIHETWARKINEHIQESLRLRKLADERIKFDEDKIKELYRMLCAYCGTGNDPDFMCNECQEKMNEQKG